MGLPLGEERAGRATRREDKCEECLVVSHSVYKVPCVGHKVDGNGGRKAGRRGRGRGRGRGRSTVLMRLDGISDKKQREE